MTHQILIIDNNPDFRRTIARDLASQPDFTVVGVVGHITHDEAAIGLARALQPDVVLLDLELPENDAAQQVSELKRIIPGARVIGLSIVRSSRHQERCRQAGMDGHLSKDSPLEVVCEVIRSVGMSAA